MCTNCVVEAYRPRIVLTQEERASLYPALNAKLLDKVFMFIVNNPQVHNQSFWVGAAADEDVTVNIPGNGEICGTAACFAGWTLLMDHENKTLVRVEDEDGDIGFHIVPRVALNDLDTDDYEQVGAQAVIPEQGAREMLGLTEREAAALFNGSNTRGDIYRIINEIKANRYRTPDNDPYRAGYDELVLERRRAHDIAMRTAVNAVSA